MSRLLDLLFAGVLLVIAAVLASAMLLILATGLSFGWHLGAFFVGLL